MQKENLPQGWEVTEFENVIEILDSQRIPVNAKEREQRIKNKLENELYPYFGATGEVGKIDDYIFDEELVALGEDGVPFFDSQKEKAYMLYGKTWVNNHAHVIKGKKDISFNKYIYYFLNQFNYLGYVNGATRLKLTQANMRKIPFILSSYSEQTQIATLLDDLLARVQAIQTRLNKIPELLKQFRQSVLADAVSGRLTEKWREENGVAFEWEETKLKHIIILISGQDLKPNQYTNEIVGIPYITGASNFTKNGLSFNRYTQYESKISEKNDLLITCKGTIGEMCFLNVDRAHIARQVMAIRVGEKIFYNYLYYFLQKEIDKIKSKAKGLIPGIAREDILTLGITLPTLEEQKAIVSIVENYLTLADTIETQTQQALEKVNLLTQSILAKAFRGELTEKWRAENQALISGENSAKALLAKIEAELQAVKKRK